MTQSFEKVSEMKWTEAEEIEQPEVQTPIKDEVDELLGELNPRFYEEAISMEEALEKVHAAKAYSNMSFNTYGF
ncbi:MAG: hypothetical protein ACFFE4_12875 [Candidatus Thorarchaeota archaeon]